MEKIPKEYWEQRIKLACFLIYYPILWIGHLYSVFIPFVRKHMINYEEHKNKISALIISIISVSSLAIIAVIFCFDPIVNNPSIHKYIIGLYFCSLVWGFLSLQFMES